MRRYAYMESDLRPDIKVNKYIFSVTMVIIGLCVFGYLGWHIDWSDFEFNMYTVSIPVCFAILIVVLAYAPFSNKSMNITSAEMDVRIKETYEKIQAKLDPIYKAIFAILCLFFVGSIAYIIYTAK